MTPNTHTDPSLDTSDHKPKRFADQRGIALQTVIIMVVLLAIAGGIAAVLLNRGTQASDQLESQAVTVSPDAYQNESFCDSAGYQWHTQGTTTGCQHTSSTCTRVVGSGDSTKVTYTAATGNALATCVRK